MNAVSTCNCNNCENCKTCNHILSQKLATLDFPRCPRPSPCSKPSQNHPRSAVCPGPLSQSSIGNRQTCPAKLQSEAGSPIPPGPRPFCNRQFFPFPRIRTTMTHIFVFLAKNWPRENASCTKKRSCVSPSWALFTAPLCGCGASRAVSIRVHLSRKAGSVVKTQLFPRLTPGKMSTFIKYY
jgi:hypothetical protein